MRSGEVCAAADDTGGSNMLLDLEVGRRVGRVEPVSPVICAPVICATCSYSVYCELEVESYLIYYMKYMNKQEKKHIDIRE